MAIRKRFQSRKVFVLHGLLLLAVIVVAYYSARAQYEALRDQQRDENRSNQEISAKASAQVVEQTMRVLVASLPTIGQTPGSSDLLPKDFISAIATVDRVSGKIEATSDDAALISLLIADQKDLLRITQPSLRVVAGQPVSYVVLTTPTNEATKIRVAVMSGEQIASLIAATQTRWPGVNAYIGYEDTVIGSVGATGNPRKIEEVITSPGLLRELKTFIKAGTIGTVTTDLGDAPGLSMITVHAINPVVGTRWYLLIVRLRQDEQINENLSSLMWQLISGAGLMVSAVAIVLVSTTLSLRRGRRRIEELRAEMLSRDLIKARRIQLNWLPAPQGRTDAVEIAAENQPAAHISGDLYNWFEIPSETLGEKKQTVVVIGDVSGHGLPAAFLMSTTQLIVRNLMPTLKNPGDCLTELNRQLYPLVFGGQFVTLLIMVINPNNHTIKLASAGQAPPIYKNADSVFELKIDTQLVAGVDETTHYPSFDFTFKPGDALLFYTDGAIESMDENDRQFGMNNLLESYRHSSTDPTAVIAKITSTIAVHLGDETHDDDLTLVALRFRE